MDNQMFCWQCQETMAGSGCRRAGMCGKNADLAAMQDLLIWLTKGLSWVAVQLRKEKKSVDEAVDRMVEGNLTATATNVQFDMNEVIRRIDETVRMKDRLVHQLDKRDGMPEAAAWGGSREEYARKAKTVSPEATRDLDVRSFRELITCGVKGLALFLRNAGMLGKTDPETDFFMQRALAQLLDDTLTGGNLLALVMETGRYGVRAMDLLDRANADAYGVPALTKVSTGVKNRPGILVAGSSLRDLEMILEQSLDAGVDVYTYDEMLSAHAYPDLHKYPHLAGNYGGAWWRQKEDLEAFHGPVVFTTGQIVLPKEALKERIFTTNDAGIPGCVHIDEDAEGQKDYSSVIRIAQNSAAPDSLEDGVVYTGLGHEQAFALADQVIEGVRSGAIQKLIMMAGGDGRSKKRSYYTDFAKALPKDTLILTSGSTKYRFNKLDLGEAAGLPRVLDAGQTQDAYSLIQFILKLREKAGLDNLNQLPVAYNLSWQDQRDVTVLLTLLYLDIRHIHLGPTMPAFISPNVLNIFVKYFGLAGIGSVQEDVRAFTEVAEGLIRPDMIVADIVAQYPTLVPVMMGVGLHCLDCGISQMETLEEACVTHGLDVYDVLDILNEQAAHDGPAF